MKVSSLWTIGTTIASCVAILLVSGIAFAGADETVRGKVVIQQDVERVWCYQADDNATFDYEGEEAGMRNDRTSSLRNVRDVYDVIGVTTNGKPCRDGLGYRIAGHGWACAASFDVVENIDLPMVDGQVVLDESTPAETVVASAEPVVADKVSEDVSSKVEEFKAALEEVKDIEIPATNPDPEKDAKEEKVEKPEAPVVVAAVKPCDTPPVKKVEDTGDVDKSVKEMNDIQNDRYAGIRERIETSDIQVITPEHRRFVRLSRNYMNRFVCEEGLENVLIPGNKDVDVIQRPTDFVLRVGEGAPKTQFMLDIFVDCGGKTYEMNAAVDSILPSQRVVLNPGSAVKRDLSDYKQVIAEANALPQEEKITKIFRRVFDKDYLQVWEVSEKNIQDGPYFLNRIVRTYFGEDKSMKVLDFLYEGVASKGDVLTYLSRGLRGERVIAIGIAVIPGKNASRVLVLTQGR